LETNEIESEDEGDYLNKLEKAEKDASDYINNETE
jgi:hypothetical protein